MLTANHLRLGTRRPERSFSLEPDLLREILEHAKPLGHCEQAAQLNLGFGFVYYGLVRALRPRHVLVIGLGYGFSVVCLGLGLKDNGAGVLSFVEPSYSLTYPATWLPRGVDASQASGKSNPYFAVD